MKQKLSIASYLAIGSMLFGMFFGAGNLIFPVHLGQSASSNLGGATLGFLITAVGLPFLGIIAIGLSESDGLLDLSTRVNRKFGYAFTILLYLTIGPLFALPRTATVPFEVGVAPFLKGQSTNLFLFIFSLIFFIIAFLLALNPGKIMDWIGKILNPIFLICLAILMIMAFIKPMGAISSVASVEPYSSQAFMSGFLDGYNTMDALASLAFGILVVNSLKKCGVTQPKQMAKDICVSGIIVVILMSVIYAGLAFMGATSVNRFSLSSNGGIALNQMAHYYFGSFGSILLAFIVTIACLKTAVGAISSASETFHNIFPNISYKVFVALFSFGSMIIANCGLETIIQFSSPMLSFLYPIAIVLILLVLIRKWFHNRRFVYQITLLVTTIIAFIDGMRLLNETVLHLSWLNFFSTIYNWLPLHNINLAWVVPAIIGFIISSIISRNRFNQPLFQRS